MNYQSKKIVSILTFFSIAILLRYYIAEVKPSYLQNLHLYLQILLLGVGPLVGGLVVVKLFKRPNFLKLFGLSFRKTVLIVSIPMLLFSLIGVIENGSLSFNFFKIIGILILYALFEEYGWRGYLQSELSDLKKVYKYLIITTLWFVWHLNFEISIHNLIFFLVLFAGRFGIGFMADRSKSLIMSALFHSFFNIFQTSLLGEVQLNYKLIIIAISAVSAVLIMRYGENRKASINKTIT